MRVLLVEDDRALSESITSAFKSQGDVIDATHRGEPVEKTLQRDCFDAVILDVGLPGIDGFEVLRRIRKMGNVTPVLILTARDAVDDRVHGLELGADDYLIKPFALKELLARVKALYRRKQAAVDRKLKYGPLTLDSDARRAWLGEKPLDISMREWRLLENLILRIEKVVSKEQLRQAVSGWDDDLSDNAIEVSISRLRGKLEPGGISIRTVRGFGYMLEGSS